MYTMTLKLDLPSLPADERPKVIEVIYTYDKLQRQAGHASGGIGVQVVKYNGQDITHILSIYEIDLIHDRIDACHFHNPDEFTYY